MPRVAYADELTVTDLVTDERYERTVVTIEGEALLEELETGGGSWVNVLTDDDRAIGVWMSSQDADKIEHFGRYGVTGDRVRVEGLFRSDCPIHQGETDIHATSVVVIGRGERWDEPVSPMIAIGTVLMVLIGIAIRRIRPRRTTGD